MKSVIKAAFSLGVLFIFSCNLKAVREERAVVFSKFPTETHLQEANYFEVTGYVPDGLLLYGDSLLLVRNAANTFTNHFSVFNLNKRSLVSHLMEAGRKQGQAMSFLSYGLTGSYLWAYDIVKDKILLTNINDISFEKTNTVQEIDFSKFHYSIQLLDVETVLGGGDYEASFKIHRIALPSGTIVQQLGAYDQDSLRSISRAEKMAYESFLFLSPSKQKCVLASRYADRIELFELESEHSKIIKGPEAYEPELAVMTGGDGKQLSVRDSRTRYAFVKGKVTDKFIYLLYSGNNHESKHLHYGKWIYVYDWDGNPVKKITLSDYVLDFVVTSDDSTIYTYDPKSKYLKKAKL